MGLNADGSFPAGETGLTEEQAAELLKKYGNNELPSQKRKSWLYFLIDILRQPMLLLLVACATLYLYIGDIGDAALLFVSVIAVIAMTVFQQHRSEKVLESLRQLSSPRTTVIRNGRFVQVAGREVVPGDTVLIREGERVPADGVMIRATNISVDEAVLTGESLPVRKTAGSEDAAMQRPGGDDTPYVYSGTMVVAGHGLARIVSVGYRTEMGRIGKTLGMMQDTDTLLQRETARLVRIVAIFGLAVCAVIVLIYGISRNNWTEGILAGLTLSMSMIPEEFTVVLILFLTFGAWRISQHRVLARNMSSIETLGAATVLCVDKTGTLTENSLTLVRAAAGIADSPSDLSGTGGLSEGEYALIHTGLLASQRHPFDPIERELLRVGTLHLRPDDIPSDRWKLLREYPLTTDLLVIGRVWDRGGGKPVLAVKGAPEAVIGLCGLSGRDAQRVEDSVRLMARDGIRVLAAASCSLPADSPPASLPGLTYKFAGLIGFADPVRQSVKESLADAYRAGIRTIMITGDYPATAGFVARQIDLNQPELIVTGAELSGMDDRQRRETLKSVNVYARISPNEKLLIVETLKSLGEVVAMTGDGVNDAPALKSAHIGIAVGKRGTDVARESSDLVLLDDDFSSIVKAVKLGRRIYDNLKKAMAYIVAVHIPIGGMALAPVLMGLPLVLMPAHIAFLELLIDPACSMVFESEPSEKDIMRRSPRPVDEPLFSRRNLALSILQGISVLAVVLVVYLYMLSSGQTEAVSRTVAFLTLVFANIILIAVNLSWKQSALHVLTFRNRTLWAIGAGAIALLTVILVVPSARELFRFAAVSATHILTAVLAGGVSLLWFEMLKLTNRRFR
ncbi:hypothetical protein A2Z33_06565 [Candidatus Gottesmanbacteria bacterium RBG_16_52_11]|uniref:Cation-transporting P-type ATPase N-terminal domain-containing protein n=1 Tax=Candidatus Gottesmanbacteria bacterium RBG_16_52_11 TaxID=1798374 RepID=A0A1F5YY19_9BACT|nr:MAG: hypothetical protein A2Z33_06565 [Candidatus Gottesmanbacteria bacterium RBG_16_52_11]